MPSAPIKITRPDNDTTAKTRPIASTTLDLHALGLLHLDGVALPQYVPVPPTEPGALLEVVLVAGKPTLIESDPQAPTLLSGPMVLVSDSAGADGEVAVGTLME